MATSHAHTTIYNHYKKSLEVLLGNVDDFVKERYRLAIMPDDPYKWIIEIKGINDQFRGTYLCLLDLPRGSDGLKFLGYPCDFTLYTPNGFCEHGHPRICISIGRYHEKDYRPAMGICGFILSIADVMRLSCTENIEGIGIFKDATPASRQSYADTSAAYNARNHKDLLELLDSVETSNREYVNGWIAKQRPPASSAASTASSSAAVAPPKRAFGMLARANK